MDYRAFANAVEEQMNQKMTGGVRAALHTAIKNNGKERTGILIESPGINISPTIYLEEYFQNYQQGVELDVIVEDLMRFYEDIRQDKSWDYENILSYEGVKGRIVFKLINTAKNRKFLNTVPYFPFLDLSAVFYVLLEVTDEGTAAMTINNNHMEQWGIQSDVLWADAVCNSKRLLPAEFLTMNYALKEIMKKNAGCRDGGNGNLLYGNTEDRDGMYVLSNKARNYGAACMAYPHILEMIGGILRKDYFVLPSSVHEVVIVPYCEGISLSELDEMVRDINETQVDDEEVLSDHAYLYDRKTRCLRRGTEFVAVGGMG